MLSQPASPGYDAPAGWGIALGNPQVEHIPSTDQQLVSLDNFLVDPEHVISQATLQKFAKITPQYPGLRAALGAAAAKAWLAQLTPLLDQWFGEGRSRRWALQAWYSLVTSPPHALAPIQRLPHVDGTDPEQIAMMLYLHRTGHGGTGFFRHRSTGLSSLTAEAFPRYAEAVAADYQRTAVFYRGNLLHSGVIDNDAPLSADPREGRLTINAFFRPAPG
jgi:Family of unknown function (DUF6445)